MHGFALFKRNDGAITVFLSIVAVWVLILAQVLVDLARIRVASTQVQNAMDLSAASALTNYHQVLKEMYGLLALGEDAPEKLREDLAFYLERTLNIKDYQEDAKKEEKIWQEAKEKFGIGIAEENQKQYKKLYDFELEDLQVAPLYNLSEPEVLRAQVLEYMKYRAPKALAEGVLEKITSLKNFHKQTDLLNKKLTMEKKMDAIRKAQSDASNNIMASNAFGKNSNPEEIFERSIPLLFEKLRIEAENVKLKVMREEKQKRLLTVKQTQEPLEREINALENQKAALFSDNSESGDDGGGNDAAIYAMETKINALLQQVAPYRAEAASLEQEINGLTQSINQNQQKIDAYNQQLKGLREELESEVIAAATAVNTASKNLDSVATQSTELQPLVNQIEEGLKEDSSDFAKQLKTEVAAKTKTIEASKLAEYQEKLKENRAVLQKFESILAAPSFEKMDIFTFNAPGVKEPRVPSQAEIVQKLNFKGLKNELNNYNGYVNEPKAILYQARNHETPKEETGLNLLDLLSEIGKEEAMKTEVVATGALSESYIKTLPSVSPKMTDLKQFLEEDKKLQAKYASVLDATGKAVNPSAPVQSMQVKDAKFDKDSNYAEAAMQMISGMLKTLEQGLLQMRDELYVGEFAMGSFTHVTTKKEAGKNLQGRLFTELLQQKENKQNLFQNAEIEYILWGNAKEEDNIASVRNTLVLLRFALNAVAIYMDPTKVSLALQLALVISAWTFGAGAPLVQVLILMAWAFAEAAIDTKLIMSGSKDVALFKLKGMWFLDLDSLKNGGQKIADVVKDQLTSAASKTAQNVANKAVDYTRDQFNEQTDKVMHHVQEYSENLIHQALDKAFAPVEQSLGHVKGFVDAQLEDSFALSDDVAAGAEAQITQAMGKIQRETTAVIREYFQQMDYKGLKTPIFLQQAKNKTALTPFSLNDVEDALKKLNQEFSDKLKRVYGSARDSIYTDFERQKAELYDRADQIIANLKKDLFQKVQQRVDNTLQELKQSVQNEMTRFADKTKEKIGAHIATIGGTSKGATQDIPIEKNNLRTAFLTADYQDYLRIFLLMMSPDTKMARMADLVQMNINHRAGKTDFRMTQANTYLRVQGEVSMGYMFMASGMMPSSIRRESYRYPFKLALYKGY